MEQSSLWMEVLFPETEQGQAEEFTVFLTAVFCAVERL